MRSRPKSVRPFRIPTINLEAGMPQVRDAPYQLERELATAKPQHCNVVKLIHGYGSTGVGGDIRIAVQKRLRELEDQGAIRGFIFGENWTASDAPTWDLGKLHPDLKHDPDLGRCNRGITIVLL